MRKQPNRKVNIEIIDTPPTAKLPSAYQILNVNDQKPQPTVYESLNTNNRDPTEHRKPTNEDTGSGKTPQAHSGLYTSLEARNVQQKPYMSINRPDVTDTTYEGVNDEASRQLPTKMAGGYASIGARDPKLHQPYVTVNRNNNN